MPKSGEMVKKGFGGNTIPQTLPNDDINIKSKKNRWCFTFNNYTEDDYGEVVKVVKDLCKQYIIGREVGEEKNTPHLQGFIILKVAVRFTALKKLFNNTIHWEIAKGNNDSQYIYCSKEGNFIVSEGWEAPIKKLEKCNIKVIDNLRPFQNELKDYLLNTEAEGKIIWIYDEEGQMGKTEFIKYMFKNFKIPFSYGGKCSDIINLVFNNRDYFECTEKPAICYNFGRETKNNEISYKSMEQVADGCISNTKFEAGCFICNKVNVCVMANCLPLKGKLTQSRWIIKTIDHEFNLIDWVEPINPLD